MNKYFLSKWLTVLLLTTFYAINLGFAQNDSTSVISQIVIMGNDKTDDNVILRELLVKSGDTPNDTLINESKKRLQNLLLFNRVEMTLLPQDQNFILLIEVTERLYLYPFPIFTLHDRDWDKLSYGVSLAHLNFRGQNEKLRVAFWFGYQPGYNLYYSDQWAGDSLHLTTNFSIGKYTVNHRTLDFQENHIATTVSVGKWWDYYFKTELLLLYDHIKVDDAYSYLMHSGKSTEDIWGISTYIRHDTRDLYEYPKTGWNNRLRVTKYGIFQENNNYWSMFFDARKYIDLDYFILAGRYYQDYTFGQNPIYRSNYIGFDERIRGHFFKVFEGNHIHTAEVEIRFPILPIRYFTFDSILLPDEYFKNLKFGINAGIFVDTGIAWSHSNEYGMKNFHTGFGAGLHFRIPYVEVLRLDYGLNSNFEGEFIFEIGNSF